MYAQHPEVLCQQDVGPEGVLYPTQQTLQGVIVTVSASLYLADTGCDQDGLGGL